jgi:hypothetical protein
MSTAHTEPAAADYARLSTTQARILEYLRTHVDDQTYFKSRLIADDLDLSAKEVGANMRAVVEAADELDVEKWGYSSGTTWMVTA